MEEIRELIDFLNNNTELYEAGKSSISDKEWDEKYYKLLELEKKYDVHFPDSPTNHIFYSLATKFPKVTHSHKMLSLDKTPELAGVKKFFEDFGKQKLLASLKMDGLSCAITYENGHLVRAETRGNGTVGDDITNNVRLIKNVPLMIHSKDKVVVHGELITTYDNLAKFPEYTNARAFAAGSARLLDPRESEKRNLSFVLWEIAEGKLEWNDIFTTACNHICDEETDFEKVIEDLRQQAEKYSFPIDGIVFKIYDKDAYENAGTTAHHPKGAIAYKFYDEGVETTLKDIICEPSRNGILSPVAVFDPVEIDGTTVTNASLSNLTIMQETLGTVPFVGQKITVVKSKQIIPMITVAEKNFEDREDKILLPEVCPVCGGPVKTIVTDTCEKLVCDNDDCVGKAINRLDHYCGIKGMDIKGLSKKTLEKLIDYGWVENFSDIYKLKDHRDEWVKKPGFGVASVDKVLNNIEESKNNSHLANFLSALGIPEIGLNSAKLLEDFYKDYTEFRKDAGNYYKLDGFGEIMDMYISNFDYTEADELAKILTFVTEEKTQANDLEGMTFVITGKLQKPRKEYEKLITGLGGKITGSVSKRTNYLICNDENSSSSKTKKAKELGVKIISEQEFEDFLE